MPRNKKIHYSFDPHIAAPLDLRMVFPTTDALRDATLEDPFRFYVGMCVFIAEDNSIWRWQPWSSVNDADLTFLIENGYTYPTCYKTDIYDYSEKTFNWVRLYLENQYRPDFPTDLSRSGLYFVDTISDLENWSMNLADGKQLGVKTFAGEDAYLVYQYCYGCTDSVDGYNVVQTYNGIGRWILQTRLKYADRLDDMESRYEENDIANNPYIPVADGVKNENLNSDLLDDLQTRDEADPLNDEYIPIADDNINPRLNSDSVDSLHIRTDTADPSTENYIPEADGNSNPNLDSDTTDGFHASQTPQANTIVTSEADGMINNSWLRMGSGGGINADMLDSRHANYFMPTVGEGSITFTKDASNDFVSLFARGAQGSDAVVLYDMNVLILIGREKYSVKIVGSSSYYAGDNTVPPNVINKLSILSSVRTQLFSVAVKSVVATGYSLVVGIYFNGVADGTEITVIRDKSNIFEEGTEAGDNNIQSYSISSSTQDYLITFTGDSVTNYGIPESGVYTALGDQIVSKSYSYNTRGLDFYVDRRIYADGVLVTSDVRKKTNIKNLSDRELQRIINRLPQPIKYTMPDDNKQYIGYPANRIITGKKYIVYDVDGSLVVDYMSLVPMMARYISILEERISKLEAKL